MGKMGVDGADGDVGALGSCEACGVRMAGLEVFGGEAGGRGGRVVRREED